MRIGSTLLALASAAFLFTSIQTADAQEIPQPLFGNCCSCKAQVRMINNRPDLLKIGARVIPTPTAVIDPVTSGMTIELSNAGGTVLMATIPPGLFVEKSAGGGAQKFVYKDNKARKNGGVSSAIVQERFDQHGGWLISVKVYGDLSGATMPEMTTEIVIGTSSFFDTSTWEQRPTGWRKKFQQ